MTKQPETEPNGSDAVASRPGGQPVPATPQDTRFFLIQRSGRSFVPIAKSFVQNPNRRLKRRQGPLAEFVNNGDKRGLLAFLFVNTIISSGAKQDGWSTSLNIRVWARALGTVETAEDASASNAATKILSRLVKRGLIQRTRRGRERMVTVTLLRPDGSGAPYTRPTGRDDSERFLRLSHRFWLEEWDKELSLPAIAMLLVALCEPPRFKLATEHVPDWYGWSADSAERGFKELADKQLLRVERETYANPLAPNGLSTRNRYTLLEPFDPDSIQASRPQPRKVRRRINVQRKKSTK